MTWSRIADIGVKAEGSDARASSPIGGRTQPPLRLNNRLHAELLQCARKDLRSDGTVVISGLPTSEEMANRVSKRREAVNRELGHLQAMGLI